MVKLKLEVQEFINIQFLEIFFNNVVIGTTLPSVADILIGYSNVDGYVSVRREDGKGSVYIEKLIQVFGEDAEHFELMDMIKRVNREIANQVFGMERSITQMPTLIEMTLRKDINF